MSRITIILPLVLLLALAEGAAAQGLSNKGKDFWVGYGLHEFMELPFGDNSQEMVLYFSAEQEAHVTVTIRGRTTNLVRPYTVPANTVIATDPMPKDGGPADCRLYDFPPSFGGNGGDGLFHVSIHIESDVPIVAYAHIYGSASSGATMLMPVDTWGYAYTSLNSQQQYADDCFSFCYIVAQHDSTVVEITPSVPTRDGNAPGVTYYATLQRGDIYQVVGAGLGGGNGYELTGTTVRSVANQVGKCYPIAFFSGSSRTANPCSNGSGGGDNDMQQSFPYEAWGKRYLTAPTSSSTSASTFMTNMYKVVVRDPATVVRRNKVQLTNFDPATMSYYFESNTADYIEADKPVLVAQFMSGGCLSGQLGDPEMMYISPIEQGIPRIGFYRNTEENIDLNFLTLIIPKKGFPSLKIDGGTVFSHYYTHPQDTNYMVVIKRWTSAKAQCITQSDSPFTAVTYGLGSVESYGYNAGTAINNLNAVLNVHNTEDTTVKSHPFTCSNTPMEFSVLMLYKPTQLEWHLSELPNLTPNTNVTQSGPVPIDSILINNVQYYKYALPGTYHFDTTGVFSLPITSTNPLIDNCYHTETIITSVTVKRTPGAAFKYTHTGCLADSVHFTWDSSSAAGYKVKQWRWAFDDGTTAVKDSVAKLFTTAGTHSAKLTVVSTEGCVADTTISLSVFDSPVVGIIATDPTVCAGSPVQLTGTTPGGNVSVKDWYWNFGNDSTATGQTPAAITYKQPGTYTVKLVGKASIACISDTATQQVIIYSKPSPAFTYPAGCLPANGIVSFVSTATAPDGQVITGHLWNFGDSQATPGNPNTATTASPSHTYSQYGAYNIQYKATTVNGCAADTTVAATFNLKPVLAYQAPLPVCQSVTGTVSVAGASVTNGVTGRGIYRGMAVDTTGLLTPSLATPGTHTITYIFTSNAGCIDSVSTSVVIYPKPRAAFSTGANVCEDQYAKLTDASSVVSGSIATWNWNYGDNTQDTYNHVVDFSKLYTQPGTYVVKLSVISDKGCISNDTSRSLTVQPLPVAAFDLPAGVCMPEGKAVFTNRSSVAGNGTLSYEWNFGDGSAASAAASPTHTYIVKGTYNVILKATSSYGCATSVSKPLSDFYDQPVAAFTVVPETLCQGTDNQFTDASIATGSTITGWNWSFADGTQSTQRNPAKQYAYDGHYTVRLTVTNAVGCTSPVFEKEVVVYVQPVIDAGPSFTVPQGTLITFNPRANDSAKVTFLWDPAADLNNASLLRPTYVAMEDKVFTVTATGMEGGCTATDNITVKVLKPVKVPSAFTPNGDGVNDTWEITNLDAYPGCTVAVFNRYGQQVYSSAGYPVSWKGTTGGKVLPVGTYYYIIDLKNGFGRLTGSVTILQ